MKFFVENMTCGGCAKGVTASIKAIDEQAEITIDLPEKLVNVDTQADQSVLISALQEDGWNVEAR